MTSNRQKVRKAMNEKQWWEESPQEFADGFTETATQNIDLGGHRAQMDASGNLDIKGYSESVSLTPDEPYHLLIWLHDNFRDRLYQQTHGSEGKP